MTRSGLVWLWLVIASTACETTRKGLRADCNSDKECLYGLVCRGAPVGEPGPRRCAYEEYARCTDDTECYRGRLCRDTHCEVQCVHDEDCRNPVKDLRSLSEGVVSSEAPKCVLGECSRSGSADKVCFVATDCLPDEECTMGRCVAHLRDHSDP